MHPCVFSSLCVIFIIIHVLACLCHGQKITMRTKVTSKSKKMPLLYLRFCVWVELSILFNIYRYLACKRGLTDILPILVFLRICISLCPFYNCAIFWLQWIMIAQNNARTYVQKFHNSACKKGGSHISVPILGTWHWLEHDKVATAMLWYYFESHHKL